MFLSKNSPFVPRTEYSNSQHTLEFHFGSKVTVSKPATEAKLINNNNNNNNDTNNNNSTLKPLKNAHPKIMKKRSEKNVSLW